MLFQSTLSRLGWAIAVAVTALTTAPGSWAAPQYRVLHAFGAGTDGGGLWSSVIFDKQGNLYGTTSGGGIYGGGTVFELTPNGSGEWSEIIVHNFLSSLSTNKGTGPVGGLVFDQQGNLYGTTVGGAGPHTYGLVYKLKPSSNGVWTETVLQRFGPLTPAGSPQTALVRDASGNLYGGAGGVFELSPTPDGWTETILYGFSRKGDASGADPIALDAAGNLYGTSELGGTSTRCGGGCGTVYKIQHKPDGSWQESVLHSFGSSTTDGTFPGFAD